MRDWSGAAVLDAELQWEPASTGTEPGKKDPPVDLAALLPVSRGGGIYLFPLAPEVAATVIARAPGLATGEASWDPEDEEPLEIRVEAPDRIVGRVVDAEGAPVPKARVYLAYTGEDPSDATTRSVWHGGDTDCALCEGMRTGKDGGFRLRGLPPFGR